MFIVSSTVCFLRCFFLLSDLEASFGSSNYFISTAVSVVGGAAAKDTSVTGEIVGGISTGGGSSGGGTGGGCSFALGGTIFYITDSTDSSSYINLLSFTGGASGLRRGAGSCLYAFLRIDLGICSDALHSDSVFNRCSRCFNS